MSNVTLYNVPPSLCSQKVRLVLVEKGVPYRNRWVDIGPTSENYKPWYVKLNPKCVVPTLTHGEEVVTDSAVIMRYVDTEFDGRSLVPLDPEAREQMETWYQRGDNVDMRLFSFANMPSRLVDLGLAKKVKTLKRYAEKHPELREAYLAKLADMQALQHSKADPSVTAENRKNLAACLDDMDTLLAQRPYLAGDSYSLADVIWTVVLTRIELSKQLSLVEVRPNVLGYYRRMQARPSYESADLWPRFKFLRFVPMAVHALGPRIAVAATVLAGVSAALWYWM